MCYTIHSSSQWAATVSVENTAGFGGLNASNAWYCNGNESYVYGYDDTWVYYSPHCREHSSSSISAKSPGQVFITTMYTETTKVGWRCDADDSAARQVACAGSFRSNGMQCECATQTVYPTGVEAMRVKFHQAFVIKEVSSDALGRFQPCHGSGRR